MNVAKNFGLHGAIVAQLCFFSRCAAIVDKAAENGILVTDWEEENGLYNSG
jgi:hypothetical protein